MTQAVQPLFGSTRCAFCVLNPDSIGCGVAAANDLARSQQPKATVTLLRANMRRIKWMASIGRERDGSLWLRR
jgi:hypothetical protein